MALPRWQEAGKEGDTERKITFFLLNSSYVQASEAKIGLPLSMQGHD
jgi:hypothetical protein